MLQLIERLLPAALHRFLLSLAHRVRHQYRQWAKPQLRGVSIILTDLNGSILLLRHSYGPSAWSLPGGGLGRNEDPEAAIRREVKEELGVDLPLVAAVATIEEVISGAPHTAYLFAAVCADHPEPDGREVLEARFFPTHSLPEPLGEQARQRLAVWRDRGEA